ncbi:hypothetical protein PPL_03505 (plasmid) [Heterostelium pallidum]|uniref:Uncharacterized protein n=1 Tax=Heterostelium pallidum (strain ATCC 26659 / Pp 5 / PN500) TaxID=670386 RepID=D3EMR3_HETP5|nr:hypothetical protein PPL_03505 [Heterostelium pallidum]ADC31712.1 hypothetical protein PPL_03505 [Heterostelium pallidum]|eukprot:YP_003422576.1 hypothetical protein PPL_03505 (plasmid) [Heterostelium pallidum]
MRTDTDRVCYDYTTKDLRKKAAKHLDHVVELQIIAYALNSLPCELRTEITKILESYKPEPTPPPPPPPRRFTNIDTESISTISASASASQLKSQPKSKSKKNTKGG